MPDYKIMYLELFHSITDAIVCLESTVQQLKQAQRNCEEVYIDEGNTVDFPQRNENH